MFLYVFGALTAYYILKPLRSGLFLSNLPSEHLVYAYWLSALFAGTVATPIFKLSRRISAIGILTTTNGLLIATLGFFWWAIGRPIRPLPYIYYVYVQVVPVLVVAQFWLLAGYIYDQRQARRIYGLLGAGASAGALAGSFIVRLLRRTIGVHELLLLCIVICAALTFLSLAVWRYRRRDFGTPGRARFESQNEGLSDLLRLVLGSRHLSLMAAFILLTMITSQVADWQINDAVQSAFTAASRHQQQVRIDEFFAAFNLYTNLLGIALQVFVTGFVVRRLGIWAATLFLPVAVFATSLGVLAAPVLLATVLVEGSDSVFRYSLHRAGLELLYMPLSPEVRKRIKIFIDVFIDRCGRAIAGVIILAVTSHFLPIGLRGSAAAILLLTGTSIYICFQLRKTYVSAFRQQLSRRALDFSDINLSDPSSIRLLTEALDSEQERQILYALRLLQSARGMDFSARLLPLLGHPSAPVREEAVRTLERLPGKHTGLMEHMLGDASAQVRRAAVDYLCARAPAQAPALVNSLLRHPETAMQLTAAHWTSEHQIEGVPSPHEMVQRLTEVAGSDEAAARVIAAKFALRLPRDASDGLIRRLLHDPHLEVRKAAARAAGASGRQEFADDLLGLLKDRQLRAAAREALLLYGEPLLETLEAVLADAGRDLSVRREIPWILGRMPSPRSANLLVRHLAEADPMLKYQAVKALNRVHEHMPRLLAANPTIAGRIYRETRSYYEALVLLQALQQGRAENNRLLVRALQERLDQNLEIIFRLLGLQYPHRDIYFAYSAIRGSRTDLRASALEFLDNVLQNNLKVMLLPLLEASSSDQLMYTANSLFGIRSVDRTEALRIILRQSDVWLKACAIYEIGDKNILDFREALRELQLHKDPLIRETAQWALRRQADMDMPKTPFPDANVRR
jgi:AAA family ATP:ADP antiporter